MQSVSVAIPTGSREDVNKNWGPVELFSSTCSKYLSHENIWKTFAPRGAAQTIFVFS